jgi:hypothetical protein
MINQIEILSPGKACRRTQKIIKRLETFTQKHEFGAEIKVITENRKFLDYNTWILPTVVVNGKILSRGYLPSQKNLLKILK